ncbi:MAG: MopE-related protein [Pseudomonadota bacterium]
MRTLQFLSLALLAGVMLLVPTTARAQCNDTDGDGDGCSCLQGDCDDSDNTVRGASCVGGARPEICDGKDNDCSPATADGSAESWYHQSCDGTDTDICPEGLFQCTGALKVCDDPNDADPDLCNGLNDDCDPATPDGSGEAWLNQPCDGTDADLCNEGTYACSGGVQTCSDPNDADPDLCNAIDDDCNPATANGSAEAWYGQACDGPDTDLCAEGVFQCTGSAQTCSDTTGNSVELCDAIDNDCDGSNNEDWPSLGSSCDGTDSDLCSNGTVVCLANGTGTRCNESLSFVDRCNGQDEDCNPATADGSAEAWYNQPCDGTDADLCPEGTYSCSAGSQACSDPNDADPDVCNGVDDDCNPATADGSVEAWFGVACDGPDTDLCAEGTAVCVDLGSSVWGQGCSDNTSNTVERCDAVDNDCDGTNNEDWPELTQPCDGTDADLCVNGTWGCRSNGSGVQCNESIHVVDLCNNNTNDDCNPASADGSGETWYNQPCDGPDSDQCREGTYACVTGLQQCSDSTGDSIEVCDATDNDCDGTNNEGFDLDGDGVGRCDVAAGDGCTTYLGAANCDCDDSDPDNFPGNPEICDGQDNDCDTLIDETFDVDGDGFLSCTGCTVTPCDCNDNNNAIYPGAPELCDCVDQDCDGAPWNGFADADGDQVPACAATECNDNSNVQYGAWCNRPARVEACDTLDNDCDNSVDENLSRTCYTGPGGTNGIGLCHGGTQTCQAINTNVSDPANWGACAGEVVPVGLPADPEVTCNGQDEDCDGTPDDGLIIDADNDTVRACGTCSAPAAPACDCNDADATIKPGATETCDAVDRNCDGSPNAGVADRVCFEGTNVTAATYTGNCPGHAASCAPRGLCHSGTQSCQAGGSWSACGGALVLPAHDPAQDETLCDNKDNDCDGTIDEGTFDADGDGARSCALCAFLNAMSCDCDDTRIDVKPGGTEICDGADNDCNGTPDDDGLGGVLTRACYTGQPPETEGVGLCQGGANRCEGGSFSAICSDEVTPIAVDDCDGYDNDCDGVVDEGHDLDGDGVTTCGGDCNDTDPEIYAGNLEICDGKDNDCDGDIDGVETSCYTGPRSTLGVGLCVAGLAECRGGVAVGDCVGQVLPDVEACDDEDNDCDGDTDEDFDLDRDGYRDCGACPFLPPDQCDCQDGDPHNRPGAVEICDCQDNNCDGVVDEAGACEGGACHDLDQDGYRNCDGDCNDRDSRVGPGFAEIWNNGIDDDCDGAIDEDVDEDRDGYTIGQGDCDDRFAEINPGHAEVCDGFDNNCDGTVDEGFDADGDHATVCAGDCDDTDPLRSPLRREVCGDNIDNDCNGLIDEDTDIDGDGVTTCQGDCNDHNAAVHGAFGTIEAAPEICDGQDNNCDGPADEGFDEDGDRWVSCLGDCDDTDPDVNPDRLEVPRNGIDDDCDGQVDEGEEDLDNDGFSPNCGDCNDADNTINPHAREACDRIDNNCDGYVDAMLGAFNMCATCFDADADGFTNCDGDCDDSEPTVYPGAPEICDLLDNDCDHSVDLDPQGFTVCVTEEDAGVEDAGGVDVDISVPDGGGLVILVDAGVEAGLPDAKGVLRLGCTCSAGPAGMPRGWLIVGSLLGVLVAWRRRKRGVLVLCAVVGLAASLSLVPACDSSLLVPGVVEPEDDAGMNTLEGGSPDLGTRSDASVGWDQTPRDLVLGDLATTACPVSSVITQIGTQVPGTELPFAVPPVTDRIALEGAEAFALDDLADDVLGFVLRQPMPAGMDPGDERMASAFALNEVQALDQLPTAPQVAERIEAHRRVFHDLFGRAGVATVQRLIFPAPVTSSYVRRSALAALSHLLPGTIQGLPTSLPTAIVATEHMVHVLYLFSAESVLVVVASTPADSYVHNQLLMGDLTNATHVGMTGYTLRKECEVKTLPELRSDFLWIIDNSASMQEEQQALSVATGAFYDALVASGLDFRLGVATTDGEVLQGGGFTTDPTTFADNVRVGINGNGREMGLEYGLRAIAAARASSDPARQLRSNAALVVIFVSDEDSINLRSVASYAEDYRAQGAQVYGIVGPRPWGCQRVGLGVARPGNAYIEVAEGTGGATGSICNPNLAETITAILIGAAGAASRSPLLRQPVSNSLAVKVQRTGVFVPSARSRDEGFDYEPGANGILFFGDQQTLPPAGSLFEVAYQYFAYIEG